MKDSTTASALGGLASGVIAWSTTLAGALHVPFLLLLFGGGIYLAIDPRLYRDGLVKLVPPAIPANVMSTLDDAGEALKRWLAGQFIAMLLVAPPPQDFGFAGVPSAFALGLIAGLAELVPLIGPIIAAIPTPLIASAQDLPDRPCWRSVLVVVQQVESNLIAPVIAGRMVYHGTAVGLFAVVAMGVLFGPLGLLLGIPLAIVFDVAVRRLYVRDTLGERVEIMGKPAKPS